MDTGTAINELDESVENMPSSQPSTSISPTDSNSSLPSNATYTSPLTPAVSTTASALTAGIASTTTTVSTFSPVPSVTTFFAPTEMDLRLFRATLARADERIKVANHMLASNASVKSLLEITDTLNCLQVEVRKPPANATDEDVDRITALLPRLISCCNKLAAENLKRLQPKESLPPPQPTPTALPVGAHVLTPEEMQQFQRLRKQEKMVADTESLNILFKKKNAAVNHLQNLQGDLASLEKRLAYAREKVELAKKEHVTIVSSLTEGLSSFEKAYGVSHTEFVKENPRLAPSYSRSLNVPTTVPQAPPGFPPLRPSASVAQQQQMPTASTASGITPTASSSSQQILLPAPLPNLLPQIINVPPTPTKGVCSFCEKKGHWSFLCLEFASRSDRLGHFAQRNMCPKCGKKHPVNQRCPERLQHLCNWFHCGAQNRHYTALCPLAPNPVEMKHVDAWKKQLAELKILYPREQPPSKKGGNNLQNKQIHVPTEDYIISPTEKDDASLATTYTPMDASRDPASKKPLNKNSIPGLSKPPTPSNTMPETNPPTFQKVFRI